MKYIIYTTTNTTDGNQTTARKTVNATDARTARMHIDAHTPNGATVRVYPHTGTDVGIMRGAVMVARRTAINAIKRHGTETQYRIEREFAAINARLVGAETPERVNTVISTYSPDTQDFYSIALLGLQEGKAAGLSIPEQYSVAYRALNAHIHSLNAATEYELSTEFLTDGGGDLVAINTAIASIIRGGDKWTPTDGGEMDAATAARLGAAIADAMRTVTPTQRKIAELLGRGYSQRKIAEKTERDLRTVSRNIAIMRDKITTYMRDNASEFVHMIDGNNGCTTIIQEETAAAATQAAASMRGGKKDAAYYREYRARKAAERKAARQNG